MEAFAANEYDVLVATTIIESGIDNPHSNTLIIEDSQRLGLAQLYQLKGRVGRSHVKAYAYFLFPRDQSLTEQAVERLTAIGENTELGSGIKIAMRDLEIRGAGSLLGAEQSGSMSAVGFDLFAQMLTRGRQRGARRAGRRASRGPRRPAGRGVPARGVRRRRRRARALLPPPRRLALDRGDRRRRRRDGRSASARRPQPARNLVDVARIRAMAAEAGATNVAIVRRRLTICAARPLRRAARAARGARRRVGRTREEARHAARVWRVCDGSGSRHARCYTRA